ncbi:PREDICTED: homeobox protein ESX1-like, partial [Propithecus coquereli]|uniref:homeobox protein ESX1-like n=1 Tax=Propithecus coquereli TaxID=379532 RepID=UPI00063EDDDF
PLRQAPPLLYRHALAACASQQVQPSTHATAGGYCSSSRLTRSAQASNLRQARYITPHHPPTPEQTRAQRPLKLTASSTALKSMHSPPGGSHEDTGYRSLGVDELQEELHDAKATVTSVTDAGGDDEEKIGPDPEGAAAGEERQVGAGAPDPLDDETQKGGGGGGDQEPAQEAAEGLQPQDRQQPFYLKTFKPLQLQELENIFQRAQYPDVFVRKELKICMDVIEASEQVWFKNRRVKWRRRQRVLRFRNMPPPAPWDTQ